MTQFKMTRLPEVEARIDDLAVAMKRFELQPPYQRQSDVWSEEKRQLFIDSLINGYDVPKLYFHRLKRDTGTSATYAIVDGKQRLETIRAFLDNKFALSQDFVDNSDDNADDAAGKTYSTLTREHPRLAGRLTRRSLDIVVIETSDLEVIEELFSRLNEAVPLNAPEKRNAFGGPLPAIIRKVVRDHEFFTDRLPIENTRYRQYDLATKFLFLAERNDFAAIKKRVLDDFVRGYRDRGDGPALASALDKKVRAVLKTMAGVFESQDELLSSVGLVTVYFMAFLIASTNKSLTRKLTRSRLHEFDHLRRHNRLLLRQQQAAVAEGRAPQRAVHIRQDLAIFDRLMQSPNDGQALEYRFRILRAFLEDHEFRDALPDDLRARI